VLLLEAPSNPVTARGAREPLEASGDVDEQGVADELDGADPKTWKVEQLVE
jgi:hypothetical protein